MNNFTEKTESTSSSSTSTSCTSRLQTPTKTTSSRRPSTAAPEDPRRASSSIVRKSNELNRYVKNAGSALPNNTRGKILTRYSRVNREQASKVQTWLAGSRTEEDIISCFTRLDTDGDATQALPGLGSNKAPPAKSFPQLNDAEPTPTKSSAKTVENDGTSGDYLANTVALGDETLPTVLDTFYTDEAMDVGMDSDTEDFWIHKDDLEGEFGEIEILQNFAQFQKI